MAFFGINFPPGRGKKEEIKQSQESEEQVLDLGEVMIAPKSESLDISTLTEMVREGKASEAVDAYDAYVDQLQEYASYRNYFASPEATALRSVKRDLAKLAIEISKESAEDKEGSMYKFEDLLHHAVQELAPALENAADANYEKSKRVAAGEDVSDSTPKESRMRLQDAVAQYHEEHGTAVLTPEQEARGAAFLEAFPGKNNEDRPGRTSDVDEVAKHALRKEKVAAMIGSHFDVHTEGKITEAEKNIENERNEMREAAEEYLPLYMNFYGRKGSDKEEIPEGLIRREDRFNASRAAYANKLTESARTRLREKYASIDPEQEKRIIERYNSLVRFNEVIRPTAEWKYQTRVEALGERGKGTFMKALSWLGVKNNELNTKLGLSKTSARFVRAVAATAVVGAVGSLTGALASVGLLGVAGWATLRVGRTMLNGLGSIGGGLLAREATGAGLNLSKDFANKKLNKEGRVINSLYEEGEEDDAFLTIDQLIETDEKRAKLLKKTDERIIEKKKLIAQALGAFATGAGLSALESIAGLHLNAEETNTSGNTPNPTPTPAPSPSPAPIESRASLEDSSNAAGGAEVDELAEKATPTPTPTPITSKVSEPLISQAKVHVTPVHSATTETVTTQHTEYRGIPTAAEILPKGMDPESPEAVAFLNRAYGPGRVEFGTPQLDTQNLHEGALVDPSDSDHLPTESISKVDHHIGSNEVLTEAVTNKLGVYIDPKVPHVYELAAHKGSYVLYGGTPEQQTAYVEQYLANPEHEGQAILMPVVNPAEPGKQVLLAVSLNQDKTMQIPQPVKAVGGKMALFEGVDSFGDKIL